MPRARRLKGPVDPLQRLPAALRMHLRQAEMRRDPGGGLGAAPEAAVLGRRPHPLGQGGEHLFGQQAGGLAVAPPPIAERLGAAGVVARRQFRHPARREGQHLGHLQHGAPLRQEPDRLGVPRLGHVPRGPVARLQLRDGEMPDDPRHGPAPARTMARQPTPARRVPESAGPATQSPGVRIIPVRLNLDLLQVGVAGKAAQSLCGECIPGPAERIDDGVVVVEQAMAQVPLTQGQPDPLHRVDLG